MKSRTLCFDCATCRMELRRFAPVWILYTLGILLTTGFLTTESGNAPVYVTHSVRVYLEVMVVYNFAYAFLLAQLLFGDLYTSRLCYAIHALPITRGGFFGTQIILGIMGSLLPNLLNAAVMPLFVKEFRVVILWWFLSSELQFLCFFGIAVLSAICTGNRFGMLILDGILNFGALLAYWFHSRLYLPLLYGLESGTLSSSILKFSPFCFFTEPFFGIDYSITTEEIVKDGISVGYNTISNVERVYLMENVMGCVLYALVGILAIWAAMQLYKKRPLECAGDLLAFSWMKPVYLGLFTLAVGGCFHAVPRIFNTAHYSITYLMLFLGLVVGYSVGLMLMKRQVNVFTGRSFLPLAGLVAVIFLSIALTGLDVLGLTHRLPDPEKIQSATLMANYYHPEFKTENPAEIAKLISMQQHAMEEHDQREAGMSLPEKIFGNELNDFVYTSADEDFILVMSVRIVYTMKDGSTVSRLYRIPSTAQDMPTLREFLSRPEVVFSNFLKGGDKEEIRSNLEREISMIRVSCRHNDDPYGEPTISTLSTPGEITGLLDAIWADCSEGTISQHWALHESIDCDDLTFYMNHGQDRDWLFGVNVFNESAHTMAWLTEHGCHLSGGLGGMG